MAEWYEAAVALYLTRGGKVFIAPQFIVEWDPVRQDGGTVPDFVTLDFESEEVVIIEVTTRATWKPLLARVKRRQQHWYIPVTRMLLAIRAIRPTWKVRTLAFLRDDIFPKASADFATEEDVTLADWKIAFTNGNTGATGSTVVCPERERGNRSHKAQA